MPQGKDNPEDLKVSDYNLSSAYNEKGARQDPSIGLTLTMVSVSLIDVDIRFILHGAMSNSLENKRTQF